MSLLEDNNIETGMGTINENKKAMSRLKNIILGKRQGSTREERNKGGK